MYVENINIYLWTVNAFWNDKIAYKQNGTSHTYANI